MTNPTSNFGWQMPTSTDLVTDLPADFETFGQAVDTSLADLKGGTTGQVLSKASNTDMDFTWVAQDDSNAIQNAIVDAKGDLIAASAADTPARLAVGNNGETLVADSSTSTGLRYQVPVNGNPVLNSAFQVFQRGSITSISTPAYVADRWQAGRAANAAGTTFSQQVTNDSTNLPFIQYCLRVQRDSGNTGTGTSYLVQSFETINSIPYAGKSVTYSFYARKGANYSATSSGLGVIVAQGTGTDQNLLTVGYTGGTNLISNTVTLTSTWQRFTLTGTVASTTKELGLMFTFDPTGTAGANDYYEITGVQLEVGSVATPFKTYAGTIQGELAACQRYYYRNISGVNYASFGVGAAQSTTSGTCSVPYPVTMRAVPTSLDYSTLRVQDYNAGFGAVTATLNTNGTGLQAADVNFAGASGLTTGKVVWLSANGSTNAYVGFSAEL